eukprot:g8471.t1
MDQTLDPPVAGSCDAVSLDSSLQEPGCVGSLPSSDEEPTKDTMPDGDREGSEAVRLLDEELAELQLLMSLQTRKVDALERLRQQWLSGERELPDFPVGPRLVGGGGGEAIAPAAGAYQGVPLTERGGYDWGVSPPPTQLPMGISEQHITPHARFPVTSPVVAAELLSFRLKGGKSRSSSIGISSSAKQRGTGGVRSGFLNVFAFLHADGMVRLRDTDGEEIVAFDAGHRSSNNKRATSSPPAPVHLSLATDVGGSPDKSAAATAQAIVVGLTVETSEIGPVLVTAGADGTARVHALTVHYRGKQVAGAAARGGRSRRKENNRKRREAPVGGNGDRGGGGSHPREQKEETLPRAATQTEESAAVEDRSAGSSSGSSSRSRDGNSGQRDGSKTDERDGGGGRDDGGRSRAPPTPPATAVGVSVAVEFKTCLGCACDGSCGDGSRLQSTEAAEDGAGADSGIAGAGTATVTSMDAFFHRSLGTTVVVAGYSSGGVRFFHAGNGTELGSVDTGGGAVLAVKRGGQSIAFSDGEDVHFANAAKFTRTVGRVCRGGRRGRSLSGGSGDRATVTALAFDAVSKGVLYVGFGTGEVMAYDSRIQQADGSYTCLPSHRLPPPPRQQSPLSNLDASAAPSNPKGRAGDGDGRPEGGCESISTVRGYAIVSQGPLLSIYNTTDETSRLMLTKLTRTASPAAATATATGQESAGSCGEGGVAHAAGGDEGKESSDAGGGGAGASAAGGSRWWVMSSSASGEVLVAEAARCSAETIVHRAILTYERSGADISWMRVPVLLLGLLVVAITQVYSRRAARTAVGRTSRNRRGGSRGWGGDDLSDDDGDGVSVDSLSRLGGGLGERGSHGRGWDGMGRSRGDPRAPSSRLPPPRRDFGNGWSQDDSD